MKFFSETVKLEKNKWLEAQRDSLAALEEIKKKATKSYNKSKWNFRFCIYEFISSNDRWTLKTKIRFKSKFCSL